MGEGGCGVSANEYSCALHVTWSPNKLWRSTTIPNAILKYKMLLNPLTEVSIVSSTRLFVLYMVSSTDLVQIGHTTFYTVFDEVICSIYGEQH
jgi:hypothetical protein